MKVISYEEWRRKVQEANEDSEPESCDECDGGGEVECEYGHFHECPECYGDGEFSGIDTSRRAYAAALAEELQLWVDWCDKIPHDIESSSGISMVVYSDIKTKKLRVVA